MPATHPISAAPAVLGIEGGATHSTAILADATGRALLRAEAGPGNVRLLDDAALLRLLRALKPAGPKPAAVALGLAGVLTATDKRRIRDAAQRVWPGALCYVTNDLETALAAAESIPAPARQPPAVRVLVLSGTGSVCCGRWPDGRVLKAGGWGHLLGDRGSAYAVGRAALRAVIRRFDHTGDWPKLGGELLRALQLNEPTDLVSWLQTADKSEVAALARVVGDAATRRDSLARGILADAAQALATDAVACARRLAGARRPVEFILAGGLMQPEFVRPLRRALRRARPGGIVRGLETETALGAVVLARQLLVLPPGKRQSKDHWRLPITRPSDRTPDAPTQLAPEIALADLVASPTEQRNPRSMNLDRLPLPAAVDLMLSEDAGIPAALRRERTKIVRVIRAAERAFRRGGRLCYVGAGTSGRLGVLDASECPPTFRTPPEQVQSIMAGGQRAIWESIEGAEDDAAAGARAVEFRGVGNRDVVVGIAASGRTPFVLGALAAARRRGAFTALLCFNPHARFRGTDRPRLVIAPNVGPEVLTGSTRLKAGTATKLVLNMITTLAMVRLGKVISNLMVDVNPSNVKLRDRAVRIVGELAGVSAATAGQALEENGWVVKAAVSALRRATAKRRA